MSAARDETITAYADNFGCGVVVLEGSHGSIAELDPSEARYLAGLLRTVADYAEGVSA